MKEQIKNIITGILGLLALIVIACFIVAFPIMLLWNWLMPEIFGLPIIDFWQALGLSVLSSLLIRAYSSGSKNEEKN